MMLSIIRPDLLQQPCAPAAPAALAPMAPAALPAMGNMTKHIAGSKHSMVKLLTSLHGAPQEIGVLVSETGQVYELGALIRPTRYGSVHRIHRLRRAGLSSDCYVRSPERLAVKIHSKSAMTAAHTQCSEENPWHEIHAHCILSYPTNNILRAQEVLHDTESVFLIMPLLDGDLLDVMESTGYQLRMHPVEAKRMFRDVLSGLSALHAAGIAHRDLSLENILVTSSASACSSACSDEQRYMLIDLGMCLHGLKGQMIACRPVCGKPQYIAPEVWKQAQWFDPMACDLWAAAVVLFMALTATAPMAQAVASDPHFALIANGQLLDVLRMALDQQQEEEGMLGDAMDVDMLLAADLMQKMLTPDPRQRLSLQEVLAHPWMQSCC